MRPSDFQFEDHTTFAKKKYCSSAAIYQQNFGVSQCFRTCSVKQCLTSKRKEIPLHSIHTGSAYPEVRTLISTGNSPTLTQILNRIALSAHTGSKHELCKNLTRAFVQERRSDEVC